MFKSYSKENFIEAVASSTSIRQVLSRLNVRPHGGNYRTAYKYIEKFKLDTSHFTGQGWNKGSKPGPRRPIEDYLSNKQSIKSYNLKSRLILEGYKKHECEICGLSKWQNKDIPTELHHVDGNHYNNNLNNLQILCPNCHHQTDNFRNTKSKRKQSASQLNGYRKRDDRTCNDCGSNRSKDAKRCRSCAAKISNSKNLKRPSKEVLSKDYEVFDGNKSKIAKKHCVSETSVRKWCKHYNIL